MRYAITFFLIVSASASQLSAQAWRKPEEKWTQKDARAVLSGSPWVKRVRLNGAGKSTAVTVRWDSARPVKLALRMLGSAPAAGEACCYAISVLGLDKASLDGSAEEVRQKLKQTASLRLTERESLAPVNASVLEEAGGGRFATFLFPKLEGITTPGVFRLPFGLSGHGREFEFRVRVGAFEIRQKFPLRDMLQLRRLEL